MTIVARSSKPFQFAIVSAGQLSDNAVHGNFSCEPRVRGHCSDNEERDQAGTRTQMGLDATVYGTCFRDGKLKSPPPDQIDVYVDDDGSLNCRNTDLETRIEFDAWCYDHARGHENGVLVSHRIGNIPLVACLRAELSHELLGKQLIARRNEPSAAAYSKRQAA